MVVCLSLSALSWVFPRKSSLPLFRIFMASDLPSLSSCLPYLTEAFRKKISISEDIKIRFPNPNEEFRCEHGMEEIFLHISHFEAGLRVPFPPLIRRFLNFFKLHPSQIHSNVCRVLMGCLVINQKAGLDLGLAEVLYCYSLKMQFEKREAYYFSTIKRSLSFVTGLPNGNKGWENGYVVLSGGWEFGAWEEYQLWAVPRVLGDPVKRGRLVYTLSSERYKVLAQVFKLEGRSMKELPTPENVDSVISNPPASFVDSMDILVSSSRCLRKSPHYPLPSPSASDAEADKMDEISLPRVVQHHNEIGDGPSWHSKRHAATAIPVAIPVKKANPFQSPSKANIIDLSPDDPGIPSPDKFDSFETEPPVQETPVHQSHVRTAPSDTHSPVGMTSVPNAPQLLLTIFGTSASDVSLNLLGQGFSSMCKALASIFKEQSQRLHARDSEYILLLDELKQAKQMLREERHQKQDAQARANKLALEVASAGKAREEALLDLEVVASELAAERAHAAEANTQFAKEKRKAMLELRDRLTGELEKQVKEARELGFQDGYAACKAAWK